MLYILMHKFTSACSLVILYLAGV